MNLPFYTYLIGVCVANICQWQLTKDINKFISMENCQIAGELSVSIANKRIVDTEQYGYLKFDYHCYNWYEKHMKEFKDKYGYTEEEGY